MVNNRDTPGGFGGDEAVAGLCAGMERGIENVTAVALLASSVEEGMWVLPRITSVQLGIY
jgi:hypothetical protein